MDYSYYYTIVKVRLSTLIGQSWSLVLLSADSLSSALLVGLSGEKEEEGWREDYFQNLEINGIIEEV